MTTAGTEPTPTDTPEQSAFRTEVRAFLRANAKPRETTSLWALHMHTDEAAQAEAFVAGSAWQRTLFEHRLAGLTYPEELGGRGGAAWQETILREECAGYDASSGFISSTIAMLGPTLMRWGTEEQKRSLVPRLLSAEDTYCQLFSEPGAGSDLAGLATRAVRDGDELVVNGQKVWNSSANLCSRGMLIVRTDPDAPKHRGITFVLVDMDAPGIEARPLIQANGAREFSEVFLTDVRIPVANVIGEIDDGWHVARTVMSNEAAFIGGGGESGRTHKRLVALARMFDRTDDPVIRQRLATAYTQERIIGLMGERILAAVRHRQVPPIDPAVLKLYMADLRAGSGELATELAGAAALASAPGDEVAAWIWAESMNRYAVSIGGGTNEVQRNNLAERALGLPREPGNDHGIPWNDVPRS